MDPDSGVKVILCGSHADGNSIALGHLTCTGTSHMEADNSLLGKEKDRVEGLVGRGSGQ